MKIRRHWWRSAVRKVEFLLDREEEMMELAKAIDHLSSVVEASREMVWHEAEDISISQREVMLPDGGSNDFPDLKLLSRLRSSKPMMDVGLPMMDVGPEPIHAARIVVVGISTCQ